MLHADVFAEKKVAYSNVPSLAKIPEEALGQSVEALNSFTKFFCIDSEENKKNVFLGARILKPTTVHVAFQDMFCILAKLTDEVQL